MKNPCDKCLVKACCTLVCAGKHEFLEKCILDLTAFIDSKNYNMKNNCTAKKRLLEKAESRLAAICQKNNREIQTIVMRVLR